LAYLNKTYAWYLKTDANCVTLMQFSG
jgi:hypothetical protein